jgi:hypothetical protein
VYVMSREMHEFYQEEASRAPHRSSHAAVGGRASQASEDAAAAFLRSGFLERDQERISNAAHAAAAKRSKPSSGLGYGSSGGGGGNPLLRGGSTVADRIRQKLRGGGGAGSGGAAGVAVPSAGARAQIHAAQQLQRAAQSDSGLRDGAGWMRDGLAGSGGGGSGGGLPPPSSASGLLRSINDDTVTSLGVAEYQLYQRQHQQAAKQQQLQDEHSQPTAERRSDVAHHDAMFSAVGMQASPSKLTIDP